MENRIEVRRKTLFIWIAVVIATLVLYYVNRDLFDISFLREYVNDHKVLVLSLYLIILTFIGLTFIPSTPFAVAGVLLFPPAEAYHKPHWDIKLIYSCLLLHPVSET